MQPPGTSTASGTSTGAYARESLLDLSGSLWANLGWLNTPLPTPLHLTATIAAIAAMVAGSWRLRRNLPVLAVLYGAWLGPLT